MAFYQDTAPETSFLGESVGESDERAEYFLNFVMYISQLLNISKKINLAAIS